MRSFSPHQLDKSAVPKDDRARAIQESSEFVTTTYGHLLSHCIEVIGSQKWCQQLKEQVIVPLREELGTILNARFARRERDREDGLARLPTEMTREEAKEQFVNEAMIQEPHYGDKIALVSRANAIAEQLLEDHFAPQMKNVSDAAEVVIQGYFKEAKEHTFAGLWNQLCESGLITEKTPQTKEALFQEINFALSRRTDGATHSDDSTRIVLDHKSLATTAVSSIVMAVDDVLTLPIRRSWSTESLAIKEQLDRGIVVTNEARQELVDMVSRRVR